MRKRKNMGKIFFIIFVFEVLVLMFVYIINIARAKERQLNLLLEKKNKIQDEIATLNMKKEILLSIDRLEKYSKNRGLVRILPKEVYVLRKDKKGWRILKYEKNKQ